MFGYNGNLGIRYLFFISMFATAFAAAEGGQRRSNMFGDRYWTEPELDKGSAIMIFFTTFLILSMMFCWWKFGILLSLVLFIGGFAAAISLASS